LIYPIDSLLDAEPNRQVLLNTLESRSKFDCENLLLTECQINTLRNENFRCSPINPSCAIQTTFTTCPFETTNSSQDITD